MTTGYIIVAILLIVGIGSFIHWKKMLKDHKVFQLKTFITGILGIVLGALMLLQLLGVVHIYDGRNTYLGIDDQAIEETEAVEETEDIDITDTGDNQ